VCRASGICTTVLGKILCHEDDQPIKAATWIKLDTDIRSLTARGVPAVIAVR